MDFEPGTVIQEEQKAENIDVQPFGQQFAERYGQDTRHRGVAFVWATRVVTVTLVVMGLILLANGTALWGLAISDTVMVALLTTTTANILGLVFIILRGLYGVKE